MKILLLLLSLYGYNPLFGGVDQRIEDNTATQTYQELYTPVTLEELVNNPEKYEGKNVAIEAMITNYTPNKLKDVKINGYWAVGLTGDNGFITIVDPLRIALGYKNGDVIIAKGNFEEYDDILGIAYTLSVDEVELKSKGMIK
jgi:uncharacterized protein with ATP-grasp and redox domains